MKIKIKLIIGFVVLMIIFGVTLSIDIFLHDEIQDVANYHNFMSIPALTTIEQISTNFVIMHGQVHEQILKNQDTFDDIEYNRSYEKLNFLIEEYEDLTWSTRDDGQYFAPEMMRQNMQSYASQMQDLSKQYHENSQYLFFNYDQDDPKWMWVLEDLYSQYDIFLKLVEEVKIMEINGKNAEQAKIITVTKNSELLRGFSITIASSILIVISILIIRGINNPIGKIRNVAMRVSQGDFSERLNEMGTDEYKELSEDINKMSEQLEFNTKEIKRKERLSAIGELSARIAHDVRNPLSLIKSSAELIQSELPTNLQESFQERFRIIDRGVSRISHQVENVLDYVRERELHLNSCNIADIIKQSFANISVPKNVKINFDLSNGNIVCDREKIETVITNLLINAVQAIIDDGQILVKSRTDSDSVIITIEDSGEGVPKEIQDKIFDPLFTTKQIGTGLGLASCKKIVETHKGSITYKNNPSTFTVMLPNLTNPLIKEKN